ncbi:HAD family phosphatase [Lipingzhangella sp. LS1_29]|uniref:HAD family phosphatase n=1 Tax=Lipingzhangella rawalii TaxID=2055835 RepID=A0ABU2H6D6_9ACTN|nr:HAD family phosphatase [Lipingzhangella rawalii]MDS1270856.1 HAD family phosphatase [Lipingzhangella rawalii]
MPNSPSSLSTVIFDYGEVISTAQSDAQRAELEHLSGLDPDVLWPAYWAHRRAYDGGLSADEYWNRIAADTGARWDSAQLHQLWACDLASWLDIRETTAAVISDLARAGIRLALLSNAPHGIAQALPSTPLFEPFEQLWFSCEQGRTKPDPVIYTGLLDVLQVKPADAAFIDDRPENVATADQLGMAAHQYSGPHQLRQFLARSHLLDG